MENDTLDQFTLIKSSRGGHKLSERGFIFDKQRIYGDVTHWQCEKKGECKARIHTRNMNIIKRTNEHTHGPDQQLITCLETKVGIKRKAQETQDSTHCIIGEHLISVCEGTAAKLPKIESLKRTIRRQRQVTNSVLPQPSNLEHLEIPEVYKRTSKGDVFLLFDSGPELLRILIFGTHQNIGMLEDSQFWLADGTFRTAPTLFKQVYTIHALRGGPNPLEDGHLLPSLFVLLPNKTEATYLRMWEKVKLLCPNAQPTHMIMDFEKAAINGFQHFWNNTSVKGCFFHFTQNIWRKVQAEGLQSDYNSDHELALRIRFLPALAFVSSHDVREYFETVVGQLPMPKAQGLILYFEQTYIGRTLDGIYHEPIFPIEMWNQHQEVIQGIPKTTNAVEAWHRSYNATIGCYHPNIWRFIDALKREQGLVEVKHAKFIAGEKPTKRLKNKASEEALKTLILGYLHRQPMEFVRGVAHRIGMNHS